MTSHAQPHRKTDPSYSSNGALRDMKVFVEIASCAEKRTLLWGRPVPYILQAFEAPQGGLTWQALLAALLNPQ